MAIWKRVIFFTMNYDDFKARVDIVDWIQRWEPLVSIGNDEWQGAHSTAHASTGGKCLNINQAKGTGHCYSCGWKGDAIAYEMARQRCDFETAVAFLANALSLPSPNGAERTPEEIAARKVERERIATVEGLLMSAADFYHANLTPAARGYYHQRGITDSTINTFKLGYAGEIKTALFDHLLKLADRDLILFTGLVSENENGRCFDVFNERYIFPYWTARQQVCFFIGRDATGGREYLDKTTGKRRERSKYKKQRTTTTESEAVQHVLWGMHDYKVWQEERPLLIVEGIVDAILAWQELRSRYAVLSPVTARMNAKDIARIADLLCKRKQTVIICNDTEQNETGHRGALSTAEKIMTAVTERLHTELGDDADIDGRLPDLRLACLQKPPEMDKIDVADYLNAGWTSRLIYWIESARSLERYRQYVENNPKRFFDGKSFVPKELSDELRTEGRFYASVSGELFQYQAGVYKENQAQIQKRVSEKLWRLRNSTRVDEAVNDLKRERFIPVEWCNDARYLNLKNGRLDLETFTLKAHSPFQVFTSQVPVAFNKTADCPKFYRFLRQVVPAECVQLVYEMIGYCLQNSASMHKAFILYGGGANGKSTLLMAMEALIGAANVAHVPLQELESDRFKMIRLVGKLANFNADLPTTPLQKCDVFNRLVAGEAVDVERKYQDSFEFQPTVTQVFACNELPRTYSRTDGYYRRLVVIPFPNRFTGERTQSEILSEIASPAELEGLLVAALAAYLSVRDRRQFSIPDISTQIMEEYKASNEPALRFLTECVTTDADGAIARSELYRVYKEWLEDNEPNRKPVSDRKFYGYVREAYETREAQPRASVTGRRLRVFEGIRILD